MSAYVLDVNETLLDLAALDGLLAELTDAPEARRQWFTLVTQTAFGHTAIGSTPAFGALGAAALTVVAARHGRTTTDADRERLAEALATLPAHPDVRPALEGLRADGARLVALSQNAGATLERQLAAAGLDGCFEAVLSAQDIGKGFKPAPGPYRAALAALGLPAAEATMVAAHPWDLAGAAAVGLRTVLVRRPGVVEDPAFPAPGMVVDDLRELPGG